MKRITFTVLCIVLGICAIYGAPKTTTNIYRIPVLTLKKTNPTLEVEFITDKPTQVKEIVLELGGASDLRDVKSVWVGYSDGAKKFTPENSFSMAQNPHKRMVFRGDLEVKDTLYFTVFVQLNDEVDLLGKLTVECVGIKTNRGYQRVEGRGEYRLGVALRQRGDDGVDTYRIPGIATTNNGTLIAVWDNRIENSRDLQGNIDIGMRRSTDAGNTWDKQVSVLDMGEWGGLPHRFNGVSDANVMVDKKNGTIIVSGLWMYGVINAEGVWVEGLNENSKEWNHQWRTRGSQAGFDVKQTSQFLITTSGDDGKSWSEPVNLTRMCKQESWWLWAPAPGSGITMEDGTLVMPTQGRDSVGYPFSNITWSKDGGKSWTTSKPAYYNTTECNVVELSHGSLMLNMRLNGNNGRGEGNGRAIAVSKDLGKTWTEHHTSRNALIEPTCMASLHKHKYRGGTVLLFVNPNSRDRRNNMTLKASFDDGNTWHERVVLDEFDSFGYSSITSVDQETIGILFEGSQAQMTFMKVGLDEIMMGASENPKTLTRH